jgi:3-oxoacyl-[acyl-carrier protein] reductase
MDLELAGKSVLVTGASRGIGFAIAGAFIREGARVAIAARDARSLQIAASALGDSCAAHVADVTDPLACAALCDEVAARGGIDILVTAAGSGASVPPGQETLAEWQRMMALNLFSATNAIAAARPYLARAAAPAIVCISSICGSQVIPGAPVTYGAAKAALNATVRGLARPCAAEGIRINAIAPGNILTPGGVWEQKLQEKPEAVAAMLAAVPQRRLGAGADVADAVLFLASARAGFITGTVHVVDGGQSLQ